MPSGPTEPPRIPPESASAEKYRNGSENSVFSRLCFSYVSFGFPLKKKYVNLAPMQDILQKITASFSLRRPWRSLYRFVSKSQVFICFLLILTLFMRKIFHYTKIEGTGYLSVAVCFLWFFLSYSYILLLFLSCYGSFSLFLPFWALWTSGSLFPHRTFLLFPEGFLRGNH